jgi:murein L,D-transpeptidase YcbB/YkuD
MSTALALATVGTLALGTAPTRADNLFQLLFGGPIRKTERVERRDAAPRPAAAPRSAPAVRISAPSYFTYKPDALVRVDFSKLGRQAAGIVPVAYGADRSGEDFDAALSGLDGFDLYAEKDIAAALAQHYSADRTMLWVADGEPDARALQAMEVLAQAGRYGLDPADYAVAPPASPDGAIRFEMALSARVLRYVRDAARGRIDPNRISGYYDFPARPLDLAGALDALGSGGDVRGYLESRHPQNPDYAALVAELAALTAENDDDEPVDARLLLKPGQSSPELPKLLSRIARGLDDDLGGEFGETLWRLGASERYDEALVPLFKAIQSRAELKPDGIIGPRTVALYQKASTAERIRKVQLALEALRWLPEDLGTPRVFINQPAFTASYIEGRDEVLKTRVVIGAPSTQTSFFYDQIEQVDYNPYWGVPQSIIVNEMLPRLRRDPGYLDRAGYEVTDARGKRVPSSSIPWGSYGGKVPYNVRQIPSEANALGELKILFPNEHAIYMHDTPSKSLFQKDMRAFSHGCIRLQDPRGMAAAVLGTSRDHIAAKLKNGHSSEKVTRKIPVYIAYFTAWPRLDGTVEYFTDVYGRDGRLADAIAATDTMRLAKL